MDSGQFDGLTRALATRSSRRQAMTMLASGAVAGLLALFERRGVAADDECNPLAKKCRKSAQCCSGTCVAGACGCPGGRTLCNGRCVPACVGGGSRDPTTCACSCPPGSESVSTENGPVCLPTCPAGSARCGADCVAFCSPGVPHPGACDACVCPPGGLQCTLGTGYPNSDTCCAADQECCRLGPVDDPTTTNVCCAVDTCVPGAGCVGG